MAMGTSGVAVTATSTERSNQLLAKMVKFATGLGCRRRALLMYFGEDMGEMSKAPLEIFMLYFWRNCFTLQMYCRLRYILLYCR